MKLRIAIILLAVLCLTISVSAQQAPPAPPAPPAPATQAQPPKASPAPAPASAAPSVTLEQLQSRLAQLQQIHEQALAQLNALGGAEQEIQRLIQSLTPSPTNPAAQPAK